MTGSDSDDDDNRTVFRQSPVPRRGAPAPSVASPPSPEPRASPPPEIEHRVSSADDDILEPATPRAHRNRLLDGAQRLLAFAAGVRSGRATRDLAQLHRRAVIELNAYSDLLTRWRIDGETGGKAMLAVCATVDDVAQNLPEAGVSSFDYAAQSMVVRFFADAGAGKRFWSLLDGLLAHPAENQDLIELYYACIAAGFEGAYRDQRLPELNGARNHAYGALQPELRESRPLSPRWRGENRRPPRFGPFFPALVVIGFLAVLALVLFLSLHSALGLRTGALRARMLAPFSGPKVMLARQAAPASIPEPQGQRAAVDACLGDLRRTTVETDEDANLIIVRTRDPELFASNSADLRADSQRVMAAVATCLDQQHGAVRIVGHSDSDRIGGGVYRDNLELSQARADAAGRVFRSVFRDPSRITTEGRGDSQPLISGSDPAAKARNRRVEFLLSRDR